MMTNSAAAQVACLTRSHDHSSTRAQALSSVEPCCTAPQKQATLQHARMRARTTLRRTLALCCTPDVSVGTWPPPACHTTSKYKRIPSHTRRTYRAVTQLPSQHVCCDTRQSVSLSTSTPTHTVPASAPAPLQKNSTCQRLPPFHFPHTNTYNAQERCSCARIPNPHPREHSSLDLRNSFHGSQAAAIALHTRNASRAGAGRKAGHHTVARCAQA